VGDIKGDLHVHSRWSDGAGQIEEMADAARNLGYSYLAITDHSKSLPVSGGINEDKLRIQGLNIDRLNAGWDDFKVLKGIEVDILKGGELDFASDILKDLDVVIASIHSNFNYDQDKQTERIISAIKNPDVDIIGHLTGRLLNRRPGYEVDLDRVLEEAARNQVILEINSHPDRLDIDEHTARQAKGRGIKIAINSDGHHPHDLNLLQYGVQNARRGWLEKKDVVNSWELDELLAFLRK
jgi:DNA polymerase (family 10)